MPKPNQNPYLVSVSFSTAAFGNLADIKRFYAHPELKRFLDLEGFSKEAALYIIKQLEMERTIQLDCLKEEDIENELPNLTPEEKKHLLDIITWAQTIDRTI